MLVTACGGQSTPTPSAPTQPAAAATDVPLGSTPETTSVPSAGSGVIVYQILPDQSEARYRVREQLASHDLPSDAVGATKQISGSIAVSPDGTIDSANSQITVDLTTLKSDSGMRDGFVSRSILGTSQYPNAVFVPKQVSGLPSPLPTSGDVTFKLSGDLTVRDVTKPVTWDVTGSIQGDQAKGTATTSFTFEDFNLQQPRVPVVLSVENTIKLEMDVTLQRQADAAQVPVTGSPTAETPATLANTPGTSPTTVSCDASAGATPALTEGPYFKAGSPEQANLFQDGMSGVKLTLTGYVLDTNCQPVANALLDFWQANAQGQYDNSGYTLRGHQLTDANGRYQLVTVVPGLYPGRTEHIHVKVQPPNGSVLTTQLFFPGVTQNDQDGIYNARLLIQVQSVTASDMQASYNFVVPKS